MSLETIEIPRDMSDESLKFEDIEQANGSITFDTMKRKKGNLYSKIRYFERPKTRTTQAQGLLVTS